jgi:hypothetical protein
VKAGAEGLQLRDMSGAEIHGGEIGYSPRIGRRR